MQEGIFQTFKQKIDYSPGHWELVYRLHATRRMFERNISEKDIINVLNKGLVIESYEDDMSMKTKAGTFHLINT